MDCPKCGKKLVSVTKYLSGHFKCMNPDCYVVRITIDYQHVKNMKKAYLETTSGKASK